MSIGSVNVPGSIGAGIKINTNILDNADFRDPINHMGYTAGGYVIDRWSSDKFVISDGYVSFQDNLIQTFEWERFAPLLGKTITLSYLNKDAVLTTATGSIPAEFNSNELQAVYFGPFIMYVFPGSAAQVFRLDGNDTVIAAKLELGPVQTLAHKEGDVWVLNDPPPNKALELVKCQRYQYVIGSNTMYTTLGFYQCFEAGGILLLIDLQTVMRIVPTIVPFRASIVQNGPNGQNYIIKDPVSITNVRLTGSSITLGIDCPEANPGDYGWVQLEPNVFVVFDSNL